MARSTIALAALPFLAIACADPPPPAAPPAAPVTRAVEVDARPSTSELVPVEVDDPILGPKQAKVTIVLWSDFECPFCARVEPTLRAIRERWPSDVRVVWKDSPLKGHPHARIAAAVGRAVYSARGNEAFWRYHDRLFEAGSMSSEIIASAAAEVGVTGAQIAAHRPAAEQKIDESIALARKLGVDGTPGMSIDGERVVGARPFEELARIVEAHLAEARALEARGVPPEAIYGALVRAHFAPVEPKGSQIDPTVWKATVGSAPVRGPTDAPVTLVVFADFQCGFCKRHQATLEKLEAKWGSKLRVAFKHMPLGFHDRALPASVLAIEARAQKGDAAFFRAHDALFAAPSLADEELLRVAADLGLDLAKVKAALAGLTHAPVVDDDVDQAASLGVRGTPTTFVNGRRVVGAQSFEVFDRLVAEELAKADAKIAAGTPAAQVYATTIGSGKGGPVVVPVPASAPWKGGADAKVVVQVFSDFECPYCRRLEIVDPADDATGGIARLAATYGKKIKIVWRDHPLEGHDRGHDAAALGREAMKQKGNAGFWKVHDALFAAAPDLSDATFESIAKKHGLDWPKAKAAIDAGTWDAAIEADVQAGIDAGVSGTPAILVGERLFAGAQPYAVLAKAVDRALAKAK